jgi:hypothetical protein
MHLFTSIIDHTSGKWSASTWTMRTFTHHSLFTSQELKNFAKGKVRPSTKFFQRLSRQTGTFRFSFLASCSALPLGSLQNFEKGKGRLSRKFFQRLSGQT